MLSLDLTRPTPFIRTLLAALGLAGAAWLLAVLPVTWLLLAGAAGTGGLLLLRWPWLIWPGLAVSLPVAASFKIGPLSALDLGLLLAGGLWLADGTRRRSLRLAGSLPIALTGLFLASQLLALPGAADLGEAIKEVVKWVEFGLILLLAPAMLGREQAKWLAAALLAGGMGQALLGLYQFVFQIGPDYFVLMGRFLRAYGSFAQPNPFAGYLGLTLPVAVSLVLAKQPKVERLLYVGAAGVLAVGLLTSWSRGGWLGAAAAVAVVLTVRSRRAALISAGAGLLLIGAIFLGMVTPDLVPAPVAERMADIPAYFGMVDLAATPVTDANFAVIERLAHWDAALRMWAAAPWLGMGPGNYAVVYADYYLPPWQEALGHAHNIYLNTLAESGLVGLTGFLLLWGGLFLWLGGQMRRRQDAWRQALAVGVLGVLTHLAVHSVFDNLFVQGIYLHLALWLAALLAMTTTHLPGDGTEDERDGSSQN